MLLRAAPKVRSIRTVVTAAAATATLAWGTAASAANFTWVGGASGDPNNYNNPLNWSPNGVPGAADVAVFNPSSSNQPNLSANATTGQLDFNTSGWLLSGFGDVLSLDGVSGIGILNAATSGTNQINTNLDVAAPQTWQVATGGTLYINGVISDSNSLTIGGNGFGGTTVFANANTFSGILTLNGGTLELGGISGTAEKQGTLESVTNLILNSGTFLIDNTADGGNRNNRLSPTATINFAGASLVYRGSDTPATNSQEAINAIALNSGPISILNVTANNGNAATFTMNNLVQNYYGSASSPLLTGGMLVNGVNLGSGGGSVIINNAPAQVGQVAGTSTDSGLTNENIVPFLLGEVSSGTNGAPGATGAGGTAFGTPNTFLTYNPTTGLRPLNPTDEFASYIQDSSFGTDTTGDNIYLTTSQSALISTSASVNSLVFNGAGTPNGPVMLTIPDGLSLSDTSGAMLFVTSGGIQNVFGTSTNFDLGIGNANVTVLPGATATINTNLTGGGLSLTVSGGGSLVLGGANNTFNNGVMANESNVTIINGWTPNQSSPYLLSAVGATVNVGGTSYVNPSITTSSTTVSLDKNSALNLGGSITFAQGTGNYLVAHLGNGSAINVGDPTSTPAASVSVADSNGMAVLPTGGVGYLNVYKNANFSVVAGPTAPTNADVLRFGADQPGADVMNVYSGATVNLYAAVLGDNGGTTAQPGILGAIYLQSGAALNFTDTTSTGAYVFSIGAAGNGSAGPAAGNDFGYLSVPTGATVGATSAPAQIDVGGAFRGGAAIGGGNGLLDVNGGTVIANRLLTLASSTIDQQYAELNVLSGGTVTINGPASPGAALTMSSGTLGSSAVINVVNSTLNVSTSTNNSDLNLAGSAAGGSGNNPVAVTALPTGVLNVNGSSLVKTGYLRAGSVYVGSISTPGQANSFLNFNGGELQSDAGQNQSTFITAAVAGVYVYGGGAKIGTGATGGFSATSATGFFAPPGAGLNSTAPVTITNGGSGYLTPPIVVITDSQGFDATGYATVNASGQVSGVTITSPGWNLSSNPTITFVGGGGTGAVATVAAPSTNSSGGLTKQDPGTFTLTGTFAGSAGSPNAIYSFTSSGSALGVAAAGSGLGNNPYANGNFYGLGFPGIRNNTSTYTGPTVIETGTLALADAGSQKITTGTAGATTLYAANKLAAGNNNVPFSSAIVVGDVSADSAATLDITSIAGVGGFQLSPGLTNGSYVTGPQVLGGFGTVKGTSAIGLTVGLAGGSVTASSSGTTSTGNNFGGYAFANGSYSAPSVNNSVIAPGYTNSGSALTLPSNANQYRPNDPVYGTIVLGSNGGASTVTFNTRQGNALNGPSAATGALTITALPTAGATTAFGAGGTYYWKLDLTNAGAGATATPGTATVSPGSSSGAPAAGVNWDELILDNLTVNSTIVANTTTGTTNGFTIQATDFSSNPANSTFSNSSSYSWVIARVNQPYSANSSQQLLASLSLSTAGLPAPAAGRQYFLSSQPDPGNSLSAFDVVVNYAPVPEPTSLALLGLGAGTLMIRRRRRSAAAG